MRNAGSEHSLRGVVVTALSLALLLAGLVSGDLDLLQDHSHKNDAITGHSENGSTHLARAQAAEELPPCNACFFRTLVGQSLIPQKLELEVVRATSRLFNSRHARSFQIFSTREENRGPPR